MQKRTAARRFFFAVVSPGDGFKRRGPMPTSACMQGFPLNTRRGRRPRRPPKRHPVGVPFCYLRSERAKLSLADRPEIIKRKKKPPQKNNLYYPSRISGRNIYLSPAAAGDIYFVRAVRRGLIKRKKETPRRKAAFTIPPAAAGGLYIYLTPSGVRYYLSLADRPGIIKRKKRKAQWAFLFFEFN